MNGKWPVSMKFSTGLLTKFDMFIDTCPTINLGKSVLSIHLSCTNGLCVYVCKERKDIKWGCLTEIEVQHATKGG